MKKKETQSSSILVAIGLPAALLCMYAAYTSMNPSEAVSQIERLESEVKQLTESQVPVENRIQTEKTLASKQELLAKTQDQLDERRRQAAELMRGEVDGMQELKVGCEINRILAGVGMTLVDEHPVSDGRRAAAMLRSLTVATDELGDALKGLAAEEAEDTPIEVPLDLPSEITPTQWIAQQRALRAGNFDGPKTRLSEMKLVGPYRSMVAGLEAVIDACPGVVVSSIAFQKPAVRTSGPTPLIWSLQLQMRPQPEGTAGTGGTMTARVNRNPAQRHPGVLAVPTRSFHAARMENPGNVQQAGEDDSRLGPQQELTYAVSKPALEITN